MVALFVAFVFDNIVARLDLSNVFDRHVARQLQRLAGRQSGACWIQAKLNRRVRLLLYRIPIFP